MGGSGGGAQRLSNSCCRPCLEACSDSKPFYFTPDAFQFHLTLPPAPLAWQISAATPQVSVHSAPGLVWFLQPLFLVPATSCLCKAETTWVSKA